MTLRFTKMQGLGNDFMVIDAVSQQIDLTPELIQAWGDRHWGVGFDQLLLIGSPKDPAHDFSYRIFNADGGEVEQCGNGARCFARYVYERGLTTKKTIHVETVTRLLELKIEADSQIAVNMGEPSFVPKDIPFNADEKQTLYALHVEGKPYDVGVLSMGNPHCVLMVDDIDDVPMDVLGRGFVMHEAFPDSVNAGFMQILSPSKIALRVFERGVGETLACGSGACAAMVAGYMQGLLQSDVKVVLLGGELSIRWKGVGTPVWMIGPAEFVFDGEI